MGKYSNVSVASLNYKVSTAISSLNRIDLDLMMICRSISPNSVVKEALQKISNQTGIGSISTLKAYLGNLSIALEQIAIYQRKERMLSNSTDELSGSDIENNLKSLETPIDNLLNKTF